MSACKGCGAEIVYARTEGGKRIALDPEPHADGNIRLWETANGKLLAFYQRWFAEQGYGFAAPPEGSGLYKSTKEWFGLYLSHRCTGKDTRHD
jgi:hypothetical protein